MFLLMQISMRSHFMCCFLLLTSFILSSENRTVKRDSYVLLFETVTEDTVDKEISLHLNGAGNPQKLIAKWTLEKYANTVTWRLHNYTKIFMDSKRNIRIANIDETYEGKYYIQYFPSLQTREVEIIITGNLADEIGEKIKSWLNDLQKFIEKYFGNLTDEIKEEMTERLTDHTFGSESLRGHIIAILLFAIFIYITVIVLLALFLMVHGAEVWKLLINAWYWCRKYRVGPQLPTQQTANSLMVKESGGTELVPPREPNASKDNSDTIRLPKNKLSAVKRKWSVKKIGLLRLYVVSFLLDSTIGLLIIYLGLKITQVIAHRKGWETLYFGEYGSPPQCNAYVGQCGLYILVMIVEKLFMTFLIQFKFWENVRKFIMAPVKDPKLELVIVMFIVPLVVNAFIFWVVDNFLKRKNKTTKTLYVNNDDHTSVKYYRSSGGAMQYNKIDKGEDGDSDIIISTDDDVETRLRRTPEGTELLIS